MTRSPSKLEIEGNFLNLVKGTNEKATASIIPNPIYFLPKIETQTGRSALTTSIQHCNGSPSRCNEARKRNKGIQKVKEVKSRRKNNGVRTNQNNTVSEKKEIQNRRDRKKHKIRWQI